jgi:hypothetical protein
MISMTGTDVSILMKRIGSYTGIWNIDAVSILNLGPAPPTTEFANVFRVLIPCSLQNGYQYFGGTLCLHLLGVDPVAMFLRNAGIHHHDYKARGNGDTPGMSLLDMDVIQGLSYAH